MISEHDLGWYSDPGCDRLGRFIELAVCKECGETLNADEGLANDWRSDMCDACIKDRVSDETEE